jgi:hypothetical protein
MYRHQHLPAGQRWITPVMEYIEEHLWDNTDLGGDIWNGRWMPSAFDNLLPVASDLCISPTDIKAALKWLQRITALLQGAQQTLYRERHMELMSKESRARHERVLALRRRHKTKRALTLYEAWRLPYFKPTLPRRRFALPTPTLAPQPTAVLQRWTQYSRSKLSTTTTLGSTQTLACPPIHSRSQRNNKRANHLKLRKLRNILLLSR